MKCISRRAFDNAQTGAKPGSVNFMDEIDEVLAIGDSVIILEQHGSTSLVQPGDPDMGK
jgi:hypothetical protein